MSACARSRRGRRSASIVAALSPIAITRPARRRVAVWECASRRSTSSVSPVRISDALSDPLSATARMIAWLSSAVLPVKVT